jgi:hypothetical protein
MNSRREEKILSEIRKRVLETEQELDERSRLKKRAEANREALADITSLSRGIKWTILLMKCGLNSNAKDASIQVQLHWEFVC